MKKRILVVHGPNINMIGERETGIYGKESFESVNKQIQCWADDLGLECTIFQSNHEGEIIDRLHCARSEFEGVIINAGAYTHYSYAIRDAIATIKIPTVEVHFSNIYSREEFRNKSVIAPVCAGHIAGFGKYSYMLALCGIKPMI
ncbi:MAG: 3-dehydroquinate dehydratase [Oscillospiraceae bacterium]|jgi:3-dehydroquinate dehydratase-2|nr:3-dehydroquinate dehydratase [Oscillospiraceae bacterium]